MRETLKENSEVIRATETARTKLKIEKDKLSNDLSEIDKAKAIVEETAKQEVHTGENAKQFKNADQRKIAVKALLDSSIEYMGYISKMELLTEKIKQNEFDLRVNLTELSFLKREYDINRLTWQSEIADKG